MTSPRYVMVPVEMREAIARIVGSFVVVDDHGGPDTLVLQDVIGGRTYDDQVARVYELTDAILSLISAVPVHEGGGDQGSASPRNDPIEPRGALPTNDRAEALPSTAFTQGPWVAKRASLPTDGAYDWAVVAGGRQIIAETFGRSAEADYPPAEANARLMAAAPDLYGAARALMAASSEDEEFFAFQAARAAVSKAEGRS